MMFYTFPYPSSHTSSSYSLPKHFLSAPPISSLPFHVSIPALNCHQVLKIIYFIHSLYLYQILHTLVVAKSNQTDVTFCLCE